MSEEHSLILSEEDEEYEDEFPAPELAGHLSKWTNYIHGWQTRYIALKDGTLSYYKSENDTTYGCRGAISIHKATIKPHELDECRFDACVNDCVWYLRADSAEERRRWVETLEAYKAESGYGSENNLRRHGSAISLASASLSGTSSSSFKKGRGLREKLAEMETFRDILCRQTDTLQSYFDACSQSVAAISQEDNMMITDGVDEIDEYAPTNGTELKQLRDKVGIRKELVIQHGAHAVDFKGEAFTFKATTAGILATLSHCIELMNQREESWKRRLEREVERRKKLEELHRQALVEAQQTKTIVLGGPDFEEGPHSSINEEEFFDAVDASLDKLDSEEEKVRQQLNRMKTKHSPKQFSSLIQHPMWPQIQEVTTEQLRYAKMVVGEGGWNLFAEDGEMRMYKREVEEGGVVVDPLKAVHTVQGVTGHEMCQYFFDADVRMDWETTIENMRVLEVIADNTVVFHQIHKRVWPATQRDSLFWSHIRRVPNEEDQDAHDIWIVCNNSTDHPDTPINKCVRVKLTVILMCQTFIDPPEEDKEITRDNLTCKITYCSTVNPGGWAPASVLRAVYKREYPKFLKRFTQYVKDQTESKPIMF